jgi:Glycosyl transferase family 2
MNRKSVSRLASIIIPCWNQLEFTRQCISALKNHTRLPWELIVVDNGSPDGTAAYLSGAQDAAAVPVTVISNRENRGFPAAINQGLQQARGEYLVLLNNDVVVTDAWLDQLVALTEMRVECHAEGDAPPYPPPQDGRHVNAPIDVYSNPQGRHLSARAHGESNRQHANLTLIDFNGGEPLVVEDSHDSLFGDTVSRAACSEDSTAAPPHFDLTVAGGSLSTPHPFDLAAAGSSLTTLHPFDLTVAGGSLTSSHPFDLTVAGRSLTTPLPLISLWLVAH